MKRFYYSKLALFTCFLLGNNFSTLAQTTFSYTGSVQTYVVPSGLSAITLDVVGAKGGNSYGVVNGGAGGRVQCIMAVTAGSVLYIYVGGAGVTGTISGTKVGGWNGGGDSGPNGYGASGGGASDIRSGGTSLSNRVVIAAAGGGGGYPYCSGGNNGGYGGGLTGEGGWMCSSPTYCPYYNPTGGTQVAGGTGGTGGYGGIGVLGVGGNGSTYAGGAGGGYYGGGGGGMYAGGAGGSSYPATGGGSISSLTHTPAYNTAGNGSVNLTAILPAITGTTSVCAGSSTTLANPVSGGTWTSSAISIASVGVSTGVVTGVSAGTAVITYNALGVYVTTVVTVNALPSAIGGVGGICNGATTSLSSATPGGVWNSSSTAVATVGASTGTVSTVSAGTAIITYMISTGCMVTHVITVFPLPSISVASSMSCSSDDTLTATGAATYSWAPSTGLSCTSCATTFLNPTSTVTYSVTGTSLMGCTGAATITVNGDRIYGHITFSGSTPDTLDMKVWLIQYNPVDSSIKATDSLLTCVIDSITYYEFDGKPAGNYLVKAKMLYSKPVGSAGYVPTYGLSTPNWNLAAGITHAGGTDTMHITMVYGTVPAGPGFISGNVYFGAGKGTAGESACPGMLVYLEDAVSHKVLAHTYTDGAGAYAFSGIANGRYIIYPEEYKYHTTPSAIITLTTSNETVTAVNFKKHLDPIFTITPFGTPSIVSNIQANNNIVFYPTPASRSINIEWTNLLAGTADIVVTDMVGRQMYKSVLKISTASSEQQVDLDNLGDGIYLVTIKSDHVNFNGKLVIAK